MDISIDLSNKIIKTERLILRKWEESDLDDFFEYASVEEIGKMAGWPRHTSKDDTLNILNSFIQGKDVFALVYRENNKVIGSVGLHTSWANDDIEYANIKLKDIGYALSKDYWGNNIMTEAVRAVIDFCFNELNLDTVTCGHFLTNSQSKRVIEKCGFKFVKEADYFSESLQKSFPSLKYVLTRDDI